MKNKNKFALGFTLIELLVVIVIIGILATIGVATFQGNFSKARDAERQSNIAQAVKFMQLGQANSIISGFDSYGLGGDGVLDSDEVTTNLKNFGQSTMEETTTGFRYYYYTSDAQNFAIYTCSEDGNTPLVLGTATDTATVNGPDGATCDSTGVTNGIDLIDAVDISYGLGSGDGVWTSISQANCPGSLADCANFTADCNGAWPGAACSTLGETGDCNTLCHFPSAQWCDETFECQ